MRSTCSSPNTAVNHDQKVRLTVSKTKLPPGASTRASSATAAGRSGRCSSTSAATTASKLPSANGSRSSRPWAGRKRAGRPGGPPRGCPGSGPPRPPRPRPRPARGPPGRRRSRRPAPAGRQVAELSQVEADPGPVDGVQDGRRAGRVPPQLVHALVVLVVDRAARRHRPGPVDPSAGALTGAPFPDPSSTRPSHWRVASWEGAAAGRRGRRAAAAPAGRCAGSRCRRRSAGPGCRPPGRSGR